MYSATEVEHAVARAIERWAASGPSELADHGTRCCREARSWFAMMDRSASRVRGAPIVPAWMLRRWNWGPSRWPIHWCTAVRAEDLDCGVLAAFAEESLRGRGLSTNRAQVLQVYPADDCAHWDKVWTENQGSDAWIYPPVVYHEVVSVPAKAPSADSNGRSAVDSDGGQPVRLWDPTEGRWLEPSEGLGYGATVAVRLWAQNGSGRPPVWGDLALVPNEWVRVPLEPAVT